MRPHPLEGLAERRVAREAGPALDEPAIERRFAVAGQRRAERGLKSRRIADEIAGMDLEEPGEQLAGILREMGAGVVLDERQVGLADRGVELGLDRPDHFALGELAAEAAEMAFEVPQQPQFLSELHCSW